MEISAINNQYNLVTKSQYDNIYSTDTMTNYPAYMGEEINTEEKKSSSGMLGLIALGTLAVAGLGYGIYKHKEVSTLAKEVKTKKEELAEAAKKLTEAEEKKTAAEKALETANSDLDKLKQQLSESKFKLKWNKFKDWWNKPHWFKPGKSSKS